MEKRLFDIHEVCNMLKTTSRTLRFYEEKHIITSTRLPTNKRRYYNQEQIEQIRSVLGLRMLGLSVKDIRDLQENRANLKDAVLFKRAQIYALIETKEKELSILNEAISSLESVGDLFNRNGINDCFEGNEYLETAKECAEAIVFGNTKSLYRHFGIKLCEYLPENIYEIVRKDTLFPLGSLIDFDCIMPDPKYNNIIYQYVRYEKLGLKIKFVFHNGYIEGLWLNYYEL